MRERRTLLAADASGATSTRPPIGLLDLPEELVIAILRALERPTTGRGGIELGLSGDVRLEAASRLQFRGELEVFGAMSHRARAFATPLLDEFVVIVRANGLARLEEAERAGRIERLRCVVALSGWSCGDEADRAAAATFMARVDAMVARCGGLVELAVDWVPDDAVTGPIAARRVHVFQRKPVASRLHLLHADHFTFASSTGTPGDVQVEMSLRSLKLVFAPFAGPPELIVMLGAILRQAPLLSWLDTRFHSEIVIPSAVAQVANFGSGVRRWDIGVHTMSVGSQPTMHAVGHRMPRNVQQLSLQIGISASLQAGVASFLDGVAMRSAQPAGLRRFVLYLCDGGRTVDVPTWLAGVTAAIG